MNEFDRIVEQKEREWIAALGFDHGGYVHEGKVTLTLHPTCDLDALEKLHRFVTNLIAQTK